ncbi:MAG: bestrophin family protein [Myxococcaceae bacterium]
MWLDVKRPWISFVLVGGKALPRIWRRVLVVTALSVVFMLLYEPFTLSRANITSTPFVLIGLPLGIFLGFRNTAAFDRFWEGRKLWGSLVNTTRSLARQTLVWIQPPAGSNAEALRAEQEAIVIRIIAYVHSFRRMLRDKSPFDRIEPLLSAEELQQLQKEENVPFALLQNLAERFQRLYQQGAIHPMHVSLFEGSLTALTDVQGACERIKNTPIPFSYLVLLHRIVGVYCLGLPFGLQSTLGYGTPVAVALLSYAFFGLDAIGDEIEQPFGTDRNDLPLNAISRTIEINLKRRLGHSDVPPAHKPRDGVLT